MTVLDDVVRVDPGLLVGSLLGSCEYGASAPHEPYSQALFK